MATYTDIVIDQGCSFSSTIDVSDKNGFPFDLTGYSAKGQIKKSYASSNAVDFATIINNPLSGKVTISLEAAQTRLMKAGRYVFDVAIYNNSDDVIRISEGQVEVTPAATSTIYTPPSTPSEQNIIDGGIY